MALDNLSQVLEWIRLNPHWANSLVFLVAMGESLAVVGVLVPGAALMIGFGALVATGALSLSTTLFYSILGAIVGDGLSFWLGRHYQGQLRALWPFRRYPSMITRGEAFFQRHGGKSIALGRFVGPIRAAIPLVAGMLGMSPLRFTVINVISAVFWAPAYILPGILVGMSLGLASQVATRLMVLLLVLLLLVWFALVLVRSSYRILLPMSHQLLDKLVQWGGRHPRFKPVLSAVLDPEYPESRGLALTLISLSVFLTLALGFSAVLISSTVLVNIDQWFAELIQDLRTPWFDQVAVVLRLFGSAWLLVPGSLGLALVLGRNRCWSELIHGAVLLTTVLFSYLLIRLFELVYFGLASSPIGFASVPSLSQMFVVVGFGFWFLLLAESIRNPYRRWLPYGLWMVVVLGHALATLYLNQERLTALLVAVLLAGLWLLVVGTAYRRHSSRRFPLPWLRSTSWIGFSLVFLMVATGRFALELERSQPVKSDDQVILQQAWLEDGWKHVPALREDLQATRAYPLNVQWLATLPEIRQGLHATGWRMAENFSFKSLMTLLTSDLSIERLPLLPQVHKGRHESLLMVGPLDQRGRQLVLRLWASDLVVPGSDRRLWLANVAYQSVQHPVAWVSARRTDLDFSVAAGELERDLNKVGIKVKRRTLLEGTASWDLLLVF